MTLPLALVGPTASGKTALAAELAEAFDAEIVCADSMTIYRGMDVGTAKPSAAERARVPHHLLDIAEPGERFTVARFQAAARAALDDIAARGKRALIVGGSGLYFRAIVDALEFPPHDPAVRARLEREDPAALAERLKTLDPVAAGAIDARNPRRVVRALEVVEITGRPFSSFRDAWERYGEVAVAGVRVEGPVLNARIDARLRAMLAAGLLDEVRALLDRGFRDAVTSAPAIGYREAADLLEGRIDADGFADAAARATRRLARRQMSWFRRDPRVRWFDGAELGRAAAEVRAYYAQEISGDAR
jgi:tRNA dimethylallyltransferase